MRDIILALFILGTIPFIITRPFFGLLVWSWLGYMNPYRMAYGFAYSFPWVFIIALVTLGSLAISKENKRIPLTAFTVLLFLFFAWTCVTTPFAIEHVAAIGKWKEFAKILLMVFVTLMLVRDRKRMDWLVWMIVVSIGFWGVKGGIFTALKGGNYHVYGPAASFIADNNDLALALCMVLPLMRYLQLQATRKSVRVGLGVGMLFTGIGILGTYSRGGLIGLVIVAAALFLKSRKRLAIVVVAVVVGITAYHFMPPQWIARMDTLHHAKETDSAQTRIQSWEFAANLALDRPFFGGGFKAYESTAAWAQYGPPDAIPRAVHSIYFKVLGEQGFPGLVLFLGVLIASWRSCTYVRKRTRKQAEDRWMYDLASMLQVGLLAYLVTGAATTSSYFDLSYQIMAMCVLLKTIWLGQQATASRNQTRTLASSPMMAHPYLPAAAIGVERRLHQ